MHVERATAGALDDTRPVHLYVTVEAPWGVLGAVVSEAGIVAGGTVATDVGMADAATAGQSSSRARAMADRVRVALEAYLAGDLDAPAAIPLAVAPTSAFDRAIQDAVRTIPAGQVTSYGLLARLAGHPGAARAAGGAVARNRMGLFVPCHRIVAGDGTLGGYGLDPFGGSGAALAVKRALLAHEGVVPPVPRSRLVGAVGQLTTRR